MAGVNVRDRGALQSLMDSINQTISNLRGHAKGTTRQAKSAYSQPSAKGYTSGASGSAVKTLGNKAMNQDNSVGPLALQSAAKSWKDQSKNEEKAERDHKLTFGDLYRMLDDSEAQYVNPGLDWDAEVTADNVMQFQPSVVTAFDRYNQENGGQYGSLYEFAGSADQDQFNDWVTSDQGRRFYENTKDDQGRSITDDRDAFNAWFDRNEAENIDPYMSYGTDSSAYFDVVGQDPRASQDMVEGIGLTRENALLDIPDSPEITDQTTWLSEYVPDDDEFRQAVSEIGLIQNLLTYGDNSMISPTVLNDIAYADDGYRYSLNGDNPGYEGDMPTMESVTVFDPTAYAESGHLSPAFNQLVYDVAGIGYDAIPGYENREEGSE